MSTPPNPAKTFIAEKFTAISPWTSRSTTPVPGGGAGEAGGAAGQGLTDDRKKTVEPGLVQQKGSDHTVRIRHRHYPPEVPRAEVRWFHAVDVPKKKAMLKNGQPTMELQTRAPKKFAPFSQRDSRAIEEAFERWSEEDKAAERDGRRGSRPDERGEEAAVLVPVNEDYLFDVDVVARELKPTYWESLVYEVRRGLWFNADGTVVDENLSTQVEDGYLKVKPWTFPAHERARSTSRSRPTSTGPSDEAVMAAKQTPHRPVTPTASADELKPETALSAQGSTSADPDPHAGELLPNKTHRLFGAYMNCVVTYQDNNTAWLLTDDFLSKMSSTMFQRFGSGGPGVRLTRGYADSTKKAENRDDKQAKERPESMERTAADSDSKTPQRSDDSAPEDDDVSSPQSEKVRRKLERQMSSLVASATEDRESQEEEARKRDEKEIQNDYKEEDGETQDRPIEHLLLVTHGIGQRLGMRMEGINFIHDVNTFRKTLKSVYSNAPDLQGLNSELDRLPKNSRIQCLPVVWRHRLDFPKQSLKHNRQELDLGDAAAEEDDEYPSLDDITVDGVPAVRNLLTDLALDVLLHQSPAYKGHISRIVVEEANRIYHLFKQRNPTFNGRVSLVGHSLGSAIMFDLLCRQKNNPRAASARGHRQPDHHSVHFDFDVEDFFALGSPIGLFQMLKGRTIAARETLTAPPADTPLDESTDDDPFVASTQTATTTGATVSAPKCERFFNIFHPTDPISYRVEPLISPAMAALKPQTLPYTKRGIFGAPVGQGLTGIGARVGQSLSGMWSGFSTGIANSLLTRSIGLNAEGKSRLESGAAATAPRSRQPLSFSNAATVAASAAATANQPSSTAAPRPQSADDAANAAAAEGAAQQPQPDEQQQQQSLPPLASVDVGEGDDGVHPPTLIDSELETLYAGFQQRTSVDDGSSTNSADREAWRAEMERQSRRLKREEGKVRALNGNGRVDYSIQEGAFDISLIASIASHLSYWSDEDVVHFMISQLLAKHRVLKQEKQEQQQEAKQ